jgi:hypothetical protein
MNFQPITDDFPVESRPAPMKWPRAGISTPTRTLGGSSNGITPWGVVMRGSKKPFPPPPPVLPLPSLRLSIATPVSPSLESVLLFVKPRCDFRWILQIVHLVFTPIPHNVVNATRLFPGTSRRNRGFSPVPWIQQNSTEIFCYHNFLHSKRAQSPMSLGRKNTWR